MTACTTEDCRRPAEQYISCEGKGAYPYCGDCAGTLLRGGETAHGVVGKPTTLSHPAAVMERLAAIEADLAKRQNELEDAADTRARLVRDWDKRLAIARKKAQGSDADARKAAALVIAIEQDNLYERLSDSEARYDALKLAVKVMETRASIGQSILRAQGRA